LGIKLSWNINRLKGRLNNPLHSNPEGSHGGKGFLVNEKCCHLRASSCFGELVEGLCCVEAQLWVLQVNQCRFSCWLQCWYLHTLYLQI
jgi:hypothetical protein